MSVGVPGSWRGLNLRPRYTERHIEWLLPLAVWDIRPEVKQVVDPTTGEPIIETRGVRDGRSSDMPATLADVQVAWDRAWMTKAMRRALVLCLGLGYPRHEAAALVGIPRQTLDNHYAAGVRALLDYLNGETHG